MATLQFRAGVANFGWASKGSVTFEVTEKGGVILQEKTWCFTADVPTSRQTVATEAKCLFKTKPVTSTTTTTRTTAAWQANKNKCINKQINKLETRLEPGRTHRSGHGHLPETKEKKRRKKRNAKGKISALSIFGQIDLHSAGVKHIRRRSGQSVTASDFGSNGPRLESGRGCCVESLDKALYSHCPKEKPSH